MNMLAYKLGQWCFRKHRKKKREDERHERKNGKRNRADEGRNPDMKTVTVQMEEGILKAKEDLGKYMEFLSKFHRYSFGNVLLIYAQYPEATLVKGYKSWQELGRTVKKGEQGIQILAPILKKKQEEDSEEQEKILTGYRTTYVFDVSQTEGADLPIPKIREDRNGCIQGYEDLKKAVISVSPCPIFFKDIPRIEKASGYFHRTENKIVIDRNLSQKETILVLFHEITHAILHRETGKTRNEKETEAEAVAYLISRHFHIEASASSFAYIAKYTNNELEEFKNAIKTIKNTASRLIERIEKVMDENVKISA